MGNFITGLFGVPSWPHKYIFHKEDIESESFAIRAFYRHFRSQFLKGFIIDLKGNENYAFVLMFDLKDSFSDRPTTLRSYLQALIDSYPVTKRYAVEIMLELRNSGLTSQEAIKLLKEVGNFSVYNIRHYEDVSGLSLVDSEMALEIAGKSALTAFGHNNYEFITPFFEKRFDEYMKEKDCGFLDLFFDHGLPYKLSNGQLDWEYYRQFYFNIKIYNFESDLAYNGIGGGYYWENIYHVVDHSVISQLSYLLRLAEDDYRVSVHVPKIGEGWVSETELYHKIWERFQEYKIVHHGQPEWLGRQHLDIFFPDLNIGIEYQGLQHYQPVEFFGGEKGFEETKKRDKRKYNLCKKNNCTLIYVDETHTFEDVVSLVRNAIDEKQSLLNQ